MKPTEAIVLVRRGAEVLVLLRCPEDGGYWHLAGGGIELGETDLDAARRELREETGLCHAPVAAVRRFVYDDGTVASAFVAEAPEAWEPVLDAEHIDYRWCSRGEAVDLLHWREARELVEAACGS